MHVAPARGLPSTPPTTRAPCASRPWCFADRSAGSALRLDRGTAASLEVSSANNPWRRGRSTRVVDVGRPNPGVNQPLHQHEFAPWRASGTAHACGKAHLMGQPGALRVKALLSDVRTRRRRRCAWSRLFWSRLCIDPGTRARHGICKSALILARTCNMTSALTVAFFFARRFFQLT